jgi:hypothetical protein
MNGRRERGRRGGRREGTEGWAEGWEEWRERVGFSTVISNPARIHSRSRAVACNRSIEWIPDGEGRNERSFQGVSGLLS